MNDLISRQAAIRWVKTECNPYGKPTLDFESGKKVIEHLEQMPSAQPESKWVPCSVRLPKKTDLYYVTIRDEDGTEYTSCMCYYINLARWEVDVNVIAWLPEPEPYKEGE